jgi:hypothetical protein
MSAANKFREVERTTENETTKALAEGLTHLAEAIRELELDRPGPAAIQTCRAEEVDGVVGALRVASRCRRPRHHPVQHVMEWGLWGKVASENNPIDHFAVAQLPRRRPADRSRYTARVPGGLNGTGKSGRLSRHGDGVEP